MFKYIVFWVSWTITSIPCPDVPQPIKDDQGRSVITPASIIGGSTCAVGHFKREREGVHTKTFLSKKEASNFAKILHGNGGMFIFSSQIDSVRIDSVKQCGSILPVGSRNDTGYSGLFSEHTELLSSGKVDSTLRLKTCTIIEREK